MKRSYRRLKVFIKYLVLVIMLLYSLWPISIMIEEGFSIDIGPLFSGQGIRFVGGVPYYSGGINPSLANFIDALELDRFPRLVLNSTAIALITVAISISSSLPAAYALARLKIRGKGLFASFLLALRTVSPFAIILPLYLLYVQTGLWDTYLGLALAYLTLSIPIAVWMIRGLFLDLPKEYYEVAEVFGASERQIFTRIALPKVAFGIMITAIFIFVIVWNEFLMANILTGPNAKPVSVGVWSGVGEHFGTFRAVDWDEINTVGTLAFIPAIAIMLMIRKYLAKGFTLATAR